MISPSPDVHLPDQSRTACLVRSRFLCRHDGRGVCRPRLIENRKTHRSLNCDRAVGYGVTCGTARFAQVAWPRRLAASAQVSLSTRSRRAYPPQRWMCSSARCGAECSGGDLRIRWVYAWRPTRPRWVAMRSQVTRIRLPPRTQASAMALTIRNSTSIASRGGVPMVVERTRSTT